MTDDEKIFNLTALAATAVAAAERPGDKDAWHLFRGAAHDAARAVLGRDPSPEELDRIVGPVRNHVAGRAARG